MAKGNSAKAETEDSTTPERSEKIDLSPTEGRAVLAAWRGIYHLFKGQVDQWQVVPNEGVLAKGFSVRGLDDPRQLIKDISGRERRLDLLTVYPWINGQEPEPFSDAQEMTAYMVQFFKGAVEDGSAKSPQYVKRAVADFKAEHDLTKKRGPRRKVIRLDNLDDVDADALKDIDVNDLSKLQATIEKAMAAAKSRSNATAAAS
jgi:hypothetical protein